MLPQVGSSSITARSLKRVPSCWKDASNPVVISDSDIFLLELLETLAHYFTQAKDDNLVDVGRGGLHQMDSAT